MADEKKEVAGDPNCPCVFCKKEKENLDADKLREDKLYAKGAVGRVMAHPLKMPAKAPSKLTAFATGLKATDVAKAHAKEILAAGAPACVAEFDKFQEKYANCLAEYINSENFSEEHYELLKRKVSEAMKADGAKGSAVAIREAFNLKMEAFNKHLKAEFATFTKNGGIPAPQNESVRKVASMGDNSGVVDMLKGDVSDATWRVAAEKLIETAKAPLVGFVVGTGKIDNAAAKLALMGFFESELGTGLLAGMVGGALTALPFDDDGGKKQRLAKELRTLFFQKGIKKGADILTAPIEAALKNIAAGGDMDAKIEELFGSQLAALPPAVPVQEDVQVEVKQTEKVAVPAAQ